MTFYTWPKKPYIVFQNLAKLENPPTEDEYREFTEYYRISCETSDLFKTSTLFVGKDQWTESHYHKDRKGRECLYVKITKKIFKKKF